MQYELQMYVIILNIRENRAKNNRIKNNIIISRVTKFQT